MQKHRVITALVIISLGGSLLAAPDLNAQAMRVRAPHNFLRLRVKRRPSKLRHHARSWSARP